MENHQLYLGEQTGGFNHEGDQSLHHYFAEMEGIGEEGDLAVTVTRDPAGEPVYLVHLPGLDLDPLDMNREDGRGYLATSTPPRTTPSSSVRSSTRRWPR